MKIRDLVPHIEFKSLTETLQSIAAYHIEASRKGQLGETCPVRFYLRTGRTAEGYIVNYNREVNVIAFVRECGFAPDTLNVSLIEMSSIEGIDLDQFEKIYQLFSSKDLSEGLGEAPTLLSLKKEFENLKPIIQKNLSDNINVDINFEEFRDDEKGCWALKEMAKNITLFVERKEIDDDFISAFKDAIQNIVITKAEEMGINLSDNNLQISVETAIGIRGVPTSKEIYQYLYDNL